MRISTMYSLQLNNMMFICYLFYKNPSENPLLQIAAFFPDHYDVTNKEESCFNLCCNLTKIKRISGMLLLLLLPRNGPSNLWHFFS